MIPSEDYKTMMAMRRYGGSFVKGLSNLCELADQENYNKLKTAFYHYFLRYSKMVDDIKDEDLFTQ